MNLLGRLVTRGKQPGPLPSNEPGSGLTQLMQTYQADGSEGLMSSFRSYAADGYAGNGIVFSVILNRLLLFSEARFKYRHVDTGELRRDPTLGILERPWVNGTTGELLARMEQDASLAGNAYVRRPRPDRLQRLRPDWVEIITRTADDFLVDVIGYVYWPGGKEKGKPGKVIFPEDLVHWSPIPDPLADFRGMSWLTPVVREINADTSMTRHKGKFFDNAATPNLLVSVKGDLKPESRKRLEERIQQRYTGVDNAYQTMLLWGGADATVIGNSFEQITFTTVQAAGENRIAAAGGVPAIIAGLKEGLQAATYSNYAQARRRFADLTMRPLWRSASAALEKFTRPPTGFELAVDDGGIPALQEDAKDAAEIFRIKAETAGALIRAGYTPDEVAAVVEAGVGLDKLTHSGNVPVTLYPEGQDPKGGAGQG